jgi:hypothetical protein
MSAGGGFVSIGWNKSPLEAGGSHRGIDVGEAPSLALLGFFFLLVEAALSAAFFSDPLPPFFTKGQRAVLQAFFSPVL